MKKLILALLMLFAANSHAQSTATIRNKTGCRWVVTVICWDNTVNCGYLPGNPPIQQQCCIQWEQDYVITAGQTLTVPICTSPFTSYKATDFPNGSCTGSSEIAWPLFGSGGSGGNSPCDNPYAMGTSSAVPNCSCGSPATISMVAPTQVEIN